MPQRQCASEVFKRDAEMTSGLKSVRGAVVLHFFFIFKCPPSRAGSFPAPEGAWERRFAASTASLRRFSHANGVLYRCVEKTMQEKCRNTPLFKRAQGASLKAVRTTFFPPALGVLWPPAPLSRFASNFFSIVFSAERVLITRLPHEKRVFGSFAFGAKEI